MHAMRRHVALCAVRKFYVDSFGLCAKRTNRYQNKDAEIFEKCLVDWVELGPGFWMQVPIS